ncbi:MAG: hypothetical protein J5I28_01295 [Acidimicrobiales bacterium]|nr:hypothetical protein [Acidimicrobiales bacterium]
MAVSLLIPASAAFTVPTTTLLSADSAKAALFSGGAGCDLKVGNNNRVNGSVHTNGKLTVGNNGTHKGGTATYVTSAKVGNNSKTWQPTQSGSADAPVSFSIGDYAPGGSEATAAGSQYYSYSGNPSFGHNHTFSSGLHYIDGHVTIKNNARGSNVTIVATGTIKIGNNSNFTPFVDGVTAFSGADGNCGSAAVTIGNNAKGGVVYAPDGPAAIGNNLNFAGVVALGVKLGNNAKVTGFGAQPPAPVIRQLGDVTLVGPAEVVAGALTTFKIRVANSGTSTENITEVTVGLPDFTDISDTNFTVNIAPGDDAEIEFDAVAPNQTETTTYTINVGAFDGTVEFTGSTVNLNVEVQGESVPCEGSCSLSLSSDGTTANISATCNTAENCGNLTALLDGNCLQLDCYTNTRALFWVPPDTNKKIKVTLKFKKVGHEKPKFYIAGTNQDEAEKCSKWGEIWCWYTIHHEWDGYEKYWVINAWIEPVDPRGFAS